MKTIIVTPRSLSSPPHPLLDGFRDAGFEVVFPSPGKQPTEDELLAAIPDAVGFLAGVEPISARVLDAAKNLKAISRNGTGVDNIDLDATERLGIAVLRAEGANARGVAELAFAHMLAAVRDVVNSSTEIRSGRWTRTKGIELFGRRLGLIGCGRVGKMVAELGVAFGMVVRAYDPYPDTGFKPVSAKGGAGEFAYASFDEVVADADVVSLHSPTPADGSPVIDARALGLMKKGVVIVNTARYELLDAAAVLAALENGAVGAVTLDAFAEEPPKDRRLVDHPRVISTPHIGGFTTESVDRASEAAVENLLVALTK